MRGRDATQRGQPRCAARGGTAASVATRRCRLPRCPPHTPPAVRCASARRDADEEHELNACNRPPASQAAACPAVNSAFAPPPRRGTLHKQSAVEGEGVHASTMPSSKTLLSPATDEIRAEAGSPRASAHARRQSADTATRTEDFPPRRTAKGTYARQQVEQRCYRRLLRVFSQKITVYHLLPLSERRDVLN